MPSKCVVLLLDGLGDRSYHRLGNKTPLQAAYTPNLDALAAKGGLGLYHAGFIGQALPSENAHFAMFGRCPDEFPGRGPLEALGGGLDLAPDEVAVLVHLAFVDIHENVFQLINDVPNVETPVAENLVEAIQHFESHGITIRYHAFKKTFGVLVFSAGATPHFTDTGVMVNGSILPEIQPLAGYENDPKTLATCRALTDYVLHSRSILSAHQANAKRIQKGMSPLNFVVTQRPGQLQTVRTLRQSHGLHALSISSGIMYKGLCAYLGMDHEPAPDTGNPETDYLAALNLATKRLERYDFIHVHSKAPDQAAHSKSPQAKQDAIEALDRAIGKGAIALADDPNVLLVVAADHSTPSHGPLIHSGEPVPVLFHGQGVRRDDENRFDEITAARGSLGTLRGAEFMLSILNGLNKTKLYGIMDTPLDQPYYPGDVTPFQVPNEK